MQPSLIQWVNLTLFEGIGGGLSKLPRCRLRPVDGSQTQNIVVSGVPTRFSISGPASERLLKALLQLKSATFCRRFLSISWKNKCLIEPTC